MTTKVSESFFVSEASYAMNPCPMCNLPLDLSGQPIGKLLACPRCGGQFYLPNNQVTLPPVLDALPSWTHPLFPYFSWYPVRDGRSNKLHLKLETLGLDGTCIFRCDDPFFSPWFVARRLGLRPCRCDVAIATVEHAARKGVKEAIKWQETGKPPKKPKWIRPPKWNPFAPDNDCELFGWGSKYSNYSDADYPDHPGNPDKKLADDE